MSQALLVVGAGRGGPLSLHALELESGHFHSPRVYTNEEDELAPGSPPSLYDLPWIP